MEYIKFLEAIALKGFSTDDAKQGGVAFLGSLRDLKAGANFIEDGEIPMGIAAGQFFESGGARAGVDNAILILTDRRLLRANKKIKNTDITTFYVEDINSSSYKTSFLSSRLEIKTTSGTLKIEKVRKDTAEKFDKLLHELIRKEKNAKKTNGGASLSGMDEIKKAKELFDAGIISQEEFNDLKKKHIG